MKLPPSDCGFVRVDLAGVANGESPPEPTLLRRSDGFHLLYPGAVHWLSGEPGGGKTWVALAAVSQVVAAGGRAVVCDYEDTAATITGRLLALGLDPAGLADMAYLNVNGPIAAPGIKWLEGLIRHDGIQLVVIDSVAESLAVEGYSENDAVEVTTWMQKLPRSLARAGATVLVVDHLAKDAGSRGRWARGSGAKLAAADGVAYLLEPRLPFSRTSSGLADLEVAKDRHGAVGQIGETVATVRFDVADGSLRRVVLDPPDAPADGTRRLRSTDVVKRLSSSGGSWSTLTEAARALGVTREAATRILDKSVRAGDVIEERGPRGARTFRLAQAGTSPQLLDLAEARRLREKT